MKKKEEDEAKKN